MEIKTLIDLVSQIGVTLFAIYSIYIAIQYTTSAKYLRDYAAAQLAKSSPESAPSYSQSRDQFQQNMLQGFYFTAIFIVVIFVYISALFIVQIDISIWYNLITLGALLFPIHQILSLSADQIKFGNSFRMSPLAHQSILIGGFMVLGVLAVLVSLGVVSFQEQEALLAEQELIDSLAPFEYENSVYPVANLDNTVCAERDELTVFLDLAGTGTGLPTLFVISDQVNGVTVQGNEYRSDETFERFSPENDGGYVQFRFPYRLEEGTPDGVYTVTHTNAVKQNGRSSSVTTEPFIVSNDC